VEVEALRFRQRVGYRPLGELVSEAKTVTIALQHSSGNALLDGCALAGSHLLHQVRIAALPEDRRSTQRLDRGRG
jgi:hypothetical protein